MVGVGAGWAGLGLARVSGRGWIGMGVSDSVGVGTCGTGSGLSFLGGFLFRGLSRHRAGFGTGTFTGQCCAVFLRRWRTKYFVGLASVKSQQELCKREPSQAELHCSTHFLMAQLSRAAGLLTTRLLSRPTCSSTRKVKWVSLMGGVVL
jgi:hypothetical protein